MAMKNITKVKKKLDSIKRIKNYNLTFNEELNKFDIFARILGEDTLTLNVLNDILNLHCEYLNNGMFEIWFFDNENLTNVLNNLGEALK